ncbi:WD40 repeat domain-containing protein, partial [Salmonella sp. s51228]|uniref:WD40 repeat domain-containing protein n=1 Tax=Salmonella sp. s51228 TaxID=3159652 RepID=UPI00397F6DA8
MVWDVETGEALGHMKGHSSDVSSFSIARDKQMIVSGACDHTAKLWDLRQLACTHTFFGHEGDINDV